MDRRNKPMSVEQKDILIEFMRSHPQLKQKFSSNFTRQDSITMWKDVTNILNSTPGANKEWKDWRKSWHDIQSRAKTKKAQINANFSKTGGGPAIDLSVSDEKIVEIIGDTAIKGLLGVAESKVSEIEVDDENTTVSANRPNETNPLNVVTDHNDVKDKLYNNEKSTVTHGGKRTKIRNVATQRLDKAVEQGNKTIDLLHEKVQIKKSTTEKNHSYGKKCGS